MADEVVDELTDDEIDLFFELTGLKFDPPQNNLDAVKKKIEKLDGEDVTGSDPIRRKKVLDKAKKGLEKRLLGYFKPIAEKKKNVEIARLEETISFLVGFGRRDVTKKKIQEDSKRTHLSFKTVREIYESKGLRVAEDEALKFYPKFPAQKEAIEKALEDLRNAKNKDPSALPTSGINDLYAFAAYLSGSDPGKNVEVFRRKSAGDLFRLFDGKSLELSLRNDDFGKTLTNVIAQAKLVFDSEDHRREYDDWLLYNSSELTGLFARLKGLGFQKCMNDDVALTSIKRIAELFVSRSSIGKENKDNEGMLYKTALAIYNVEANCQYGPLEMNDNDVFIECAECGQRREFPSLEKARDQNECKNCGKPLFRKCARCGEMVPMSEDKCPRCGSVFANAELAKKRLRDAEGALDKGEFAKAREFLRLAGEFIPK